MHLITSHLLTAIVTATLFLGLSLAYAWTGPSAAPPNSNVSAPINVGTVDQVKNAGLAVNALAVFGGTSVTGNVTAAGFFHSSDLHLKKNVRTIGGLDLVSQLRGVSFDWEKDGTASAGVIAQEVEMVLPSAVRTGANGTKYVEYDQLIAPLIEAVKEQQSEINALKHEIEHIKTSR